MSVIQTKIQLKLRVYNQETGDAILLPVSEAALSFGLNAVPVCGVRIGLGADLGHPRLETRVNAVTRKLLRKHATCELLAIFTGEAVVGSKWPEEAQMIFQGRIGAVQDSIIANAAGLKVTINHWLGDLSAGSIVAFHANSLDPSGVLDYAAAYSVRRTGAQNPPASVGTLADAAILKSSNVGADLWARGLKSLWASILSNPNPTGFNDEECGRELVLPPPELPEALRRVEGPVTGEGQDLSLDYSDWAVPIRFTSSNEDDDRRQVAKSIADAISDSSIASYAGTDVWSLLVQKFCPQLDLVLVPRINSAIVAPAMPVLRTPYCQRIISSDIVSVDGSRRLHRPVRGIGIVQSHESRTGIDQKFISPKPICYIPENAPEGGRIFYQKPPSWLSALPRISEAQRRLINFRRVPRPRAGFRDDEEPYQVAIANARQSILYQYARTRYASMSAHGSTANVTGRLRFDIAPGSTVEVQAKTSQIAGLGVDTPQLQGYVSHVTIMLSAQKARAYTQYQLQYVRSLEDNARDEVTVEQHPLYLETYYGAPLSEELAVPACP